MDKRKILIQLDSDPQPSVFDRVVAVDAGADEVFSYGGVKPADVQGLVHGAIFTRGPKDLKRSAFFIGGSNVAAGEELLREAQKHLLPQFGLRVSILLDANGANTTAAAAVCAAKRHVELKGCPALVLGGTGPVGQRVARLLAREGAEIRVGSRQQARAAAVCQDIAAKVSSAKLTPMANGSAQELSAALAGRTLVIAAGAASAVLLPKAARPACPTLKVAIDLNAVPPLGIEGVEVMDKGATRDGVVCYGAIGVGDTKMKTHKAAIARLFESNDQIMDAEEVYQIALSLM
ncbi:MAG: NADP-dependent methylenetetrahydromethanopterin/methylenetetrahydrofolate dehydrogenase [Gemmataceae bacterium]|nr:NADP-dependent methylenetetrahydromethanopterin/methylenetetrahydrofolate dehydrogenase [Gemmataceae bacterium]MCI0738843.1 NADP-dependent methylenetetrahydromethanopterin/methylenetetrahydrofolate dehydrogenase [Gemmataceae bacterium]